VAVIGDSAGAHFSLPPQWLNVTMFNGKQFNDMFSVLTDELDFPMNGGYTGTRPNSLKSPLSSVYKYMVERNRCNYNDY
jgi:acyloxyacyl hydrolase